MKKILFLLFICSNLNAQTIENYLNVKNLEISELYNKIYIIDKNTYSSSIEAMNSANSIIFSFQEYSKIELKKPLEDSILKIVYSNSKFNFEINSDWIKTYFNTTDLLVKSKMLSSLVTNNLEKYRTFNK